MGLQHHNFVVSKQIQQATADEEEVKGIQLWTEATPQIRGGEPLEALAGQQSRSPQAPILPTVENNHNSDADSRLTIFPT